MTTTRMPGAEVLGPRESQPPKPGEPDMALLYLGSLFETLDYTLPPECDAAAIPAL